MKNKHAQFSYNLNLAKNDYFFICEFPYDLSDLINIEYEFENGDIMNIDYFLFYPNKEQKENKDSHVSLTNKNNPFLTPNNLDSNELFEKEMRFLNEENNFWDFNTTDGKLKCKVDKKNKYNIFLQTSFDFKNLFDAINVMINCSILFYSNNYKIIGIENQNSGGSAILYQMWHQLIQQKTLGKTFRSLIINDDAFDYFKKQEFFKKTNVETCKSFDSMEDMGEIVDNYGKSEIFHEEIKHHRTKLYEFLNGALREVLQGLRKYFYNNNNLKNPTDILIYTDSYCYSACSGFIKAFQNTGGAIIVGFNGNPKIKGTKEFDASQSSSSVNNFNDTKEYMELNNLGYKVFGITYSESFDDSYQDKYKTPIPREYVVDLVDGRVPIYSSYSDDLYESFISHADKIFKEFETNCNKNNKKLILDDEECFFDGHERGGHPCGDDGKWDLEKCEAYYCDDPDYYFDQFKKKCVKDICSNIENKRNIDINENIPFERKEFILEQNSEIVFHLPDNNNFNYIFESNKENIFSRYYEDSLIKCSNLCIIGNEPKNIFENVVNVNYFRKLKENAIIKLTALDKNQNILMKDNIDSKKGFVPYYMNILGDKQVIYSFQSNKKKIIYIPSFNNGLKIYYSEYNFDISPQDLINIAPKKFKEYSNKIINMEENKQYIFNLKFPNGKLSGAFLFIKPNDISQYLLIRNDTYLYLTQHNFEYNLYFNYDIKSVYIKLNGLTPDAEIEILNNDNSVINKNNKYFLFESVNKKLTLRLKNGNPALIEFLYKLENVNNLDRDKKEYNLINNTYYMLKYRKSDNIKTIKLNLKSNYPLSIILYANIGKGNYLGAIPDELDVESTDISSVYNMPNELLDNDETFNILLKVKNKATLYVELNDNEIDNPNRFALPAWTFIAIIAVIVIGILMVILFVKMILKCFRKGNVSSENIEKKKFFDFMQLIEV